MLSILISCSISCLLSLVGNADVTGKRRLARSDGHRFLKVAAAGCENESAHKGDLACLPTRPHDLFYESDNQLATAAMPRSRL